MIPYNHQPMYERLTDDLCASDIDERRIGGQLVAVSH